jgi:probable phosphoglycerate mutase
MRLATTLSPLDFDAVVASPLRRAVQTAHILNRRLKKPMLTHPFLVERNFGSLSGKTWEEIEKEMGKALKKRDRMARYDYRPWGGESAGEVKKRLREFMKWVGGLRYENVLVVTHGGIIKMMYLLQRKRRPQSIENASVHKFNI